MRLKGNLWRIVVIAFGIAAMIYLGGTRPYPAFGGEDLLGILCIVFGLWPEKEEEEEW